MLVCNSTIIITSSSGLSFLLNVVALPHYMVQSNDHSPCSIVFKTIYLIPVVLWLNVKVP